jgi:cyclic-di-AMP phosphodiesterase PgpH
MMPLNREFIKSIRWQEIWQRRILLKVTLLALLSLVIGYLLAPKLFNRQESYQEGDVVRQNIVVAKDMMIEDVLSTNLKQQQLLNEQGQIYDYDPSISEETVRRIRGTFLAARGMLSDLQAEIDQRYQLNRYSGIEYFQLTQDIHGIQSKISIYKKYQKDIKDKLSELKLGVGLSSQNFMKKNKLDWELNTIQYLLSSLQNREEQVQQQIKNVREHLNTLLKNQTEYNDGLDEKKMGIISDVFKNLFITREEINRSLVNFPFYTEEIESQIVILLEGLLSQKIFASKKGFLADKINLVIQNVKTSESDTIKSLVGFKDLEDIHVELDNQARQLIPDENDNTKREFIIWLAKKQLYPTITENKLALEKKREELIKNMNPIFYSVKKGQVIARAGERVNSNQLQLIKGYLNTLKLNDNIPRLIGVILIAFFSLLLVFMAVFNKSYIKSFTFKKLIMMGTTIIITMILTKTGIEIKELIELRYIEFDSEFYSYVFPVTLSAMLVGILINFEVGIMSGLLTSLFISIMMKDNFYYFYFSIMGCIVAALPISKFDSRYSLIQHGLKISGVNMIMVLLLFLINENQIDTNTGLALLMALLGGVFTAVITSILLPFYESIFDITTNLKLLELSNMNHPLLKELIFKAPGTYQHSIVVGNLAESGADKIGANSLLARVSSYYHDIGKGENSHYFIENQPAHSKNIHDDMDPYESANIIFKHLSDGKEKAEKYNLGRDIIGILMQHHGTGVVKIFHQKAITQAQDSVHDLEINELDFQYPGPKPQTLEAALVMIADISEASTRSLDDPTSESIDQMVNKVGWRLLESGQLDESGITLLQFRMILDQYCSVLKAIHHHRIKYPEQLINEPSNK